ncbi:MAG: PAS domain S-box protein [Anaerolineae bacterium]
MMKDKNKTKEQLTNELVEMRQRIAELEASESKRRQVEEELRESERKLRLIAENTTDVIFAYDMDRRLIYVNPAVEELTGYSVAELQERNFINWLHPEDEARMMKLWEGLFEGKGFSGEEFRIVTKDGQVKWGLSSWGPLYDESGRQIGIQGRERDITKRKRAEEELRASEQRYRLLFERNLAGVYRTTLDGRVLDCNEAFARILGYDSREEVLALRASKFYFDAADRETFIARLREQGTLTNSEGCLRRKDNSPVWVLENSSLIEGEEGAPTFIQGTLVDITKRKRAERLLQALNQAARAMGKAMTPEEIFTAVAEELKKLGFFCTVLLTDESQKRLFPKYLSYEAKAIKAAEKLVGLKAEDLPIPVETVEIYRKVIRERKTVFVENAEEVVRQLLPGPTKRLTRQIAKMLKVSKSIDAPLIAEDEVIGLLLVQSDDLTEDDIPAITAFAHQMAAAWRKARLMQDLEKSLAEQKRAQEELQQSFKQLRRALEGTVNTLVSAIEMRDPYTAGHQRRVTQLACAIANEMGLPQERIEGLRMAGLIHDIGKINVPAEILSKPGPLTELEYGLIKMHPQTGHDVLNGTIEFPWPLAQIVLQHHERMDGSGYPQGLSGEEIILEARILGVADVVEAMASHRPYRSARGIDEALEEISGNRGVLYDPEVVDTCLKLFTEKGFTFE